MYNSFFYLLPISLSHFWHPLIHINVLFSLLMECCALLWFIYTIQICFSGGIFFLLYFSIWNLFPSLDSYNMVKFFLQIYKIEGARHFMPLHTTVKSFLLSLTSIWSLPSVIFLYIHSICNVNYIADSSYMINQGIKNPMCFIFYCCYTE